jgi:sarcosine oxidase subunit gamma
MIRKVRVSMLDAQFPQIPANAFVDLAPPSRIVGMAAFTGTSEALTAALGVALPLTPRQVIAGSTKILWAGANTWLVVGDDAEIAARIETAADQNLAAVTEQTDGRTILRISGPHASEILAKLVPMDLDPSVFGPDATALTLAGHINVQIWREDRDFLLSCFRSFAESLAHALVEASREFV